MHKALNGKMNWDNAVKFDIKADLQGQRSGPGMIYTPTVTINVPKGLTVDMSGNLKYTPWKLFETELVVKGLTSKPLTVKCKY